MNALQFRRSGPNDFSQLLMASAVSSPMPRTWSSCCVEARQNGRCVSEMLQQLPHAHRADVLDHVQGDERFLGIHARGILKIFAGSKAEITIAFCPRSV